MDEKISLLNQLISLAGTDKKIREEEYEFLLKLSKMMGVDRETFDRLFRENVDFTPPKPETERILQFQRLILLSNIDMKVTPLELDFLKRAGIKMGLHPDAVSAVLEEMKERKFGMIPPEKLISIFKVYHN